MENQYPDEAKREEIANACNSVIQKPGTKTLSQQCPRADIQNKLTLLLTPHPRPGGFSPGFEPIAHEIQKGTDWGATNQYQ